MGVAERRIPASVSHHPKNPENRDENAELGKNVFFLAGVHEHRFSPQPAIGMLGDCHCHGGSESHKALASQFEKLRAMRFLSPPLCRTNDKLVLAS